MKYKYFDGNGFENWHRLDYVMTHDKNKDGLECGCKFCSNPNFYYTIDICDMVHAKYEKSNYQLNKLIEYLRNEMGFSVQEINEIIK